MERGSMSRGPTEIARIRAEDALSDALDAIRALRHRDDRMWKLRRSAKKRARTVRRRWETTAPAVGATVRSSARGAVLLAGSGRGVAFGAGALTGLTIGVWVGRAATDAAVREDMARLTGPVSQTSHAIAGKASAAADVSVRSLKSSGHAVSSATTRAAATVAHAPATVWTGIAGKADGNGGGRKNDAPAD